MHLRACIVAVAAALALLLVPAAAQANHPFSVSKSEAAAGDEVEFQISGTQAGESYIVKVDDQEVASGVDSAGNGVTDKFKMPDLGSSNKSASVEVRITPLGGEPDHLGSQPMQFLAPFSGASTPEPPAQPAPAVTVPAPALDSGPEKSNTPTPTDRTEKTGSGNKNNDNNSSPKTSDNPNPTSDPAPTATTVTPTDTSSGSSSSESSPVSANPVPDVPGPSGPNAPVGASLASALSPLSGVAEPGKTGFPILVLLLIALIAAAVLTAAGPRLWQKWEPELPWGPNVDDEVRLGALQRASASGAELQQTIASRRATRSAGRTG